jgi:hypothetical protein
MPLYMTAEKPKRPASSYGKRRVLVMMAGGEKKSRPKLSVLLVGDFRLTDASAPACLYTWNDHAVWVTMIARSWRIDE